MMYSGLFWSIVFDSMYSVVCVWSDPTGVVLMFLWYSSTIPPPFLLPCWLCCCSMTFDCVRSDWLIHAWSLGVSLSQVSVSRPMSIFALMNSFTIISSLFFIDLAFSVAGFIVDAVSFPILLVTVTYNRLSWLQLFVMQGCLVTVIGLFFILCCLILDIVPGGST